MRAFRLLAWHVVLVMTVWAALSGRAHATTIVAPDTLAAVEGNVANGYPFNLDLFFPTQRYQQVYNSSQFSALTTPEFITQIAFRPDSGGSGDPFSSTHANVQINLAIAAFGPDALSTTFANNIGSNDTIVYSGALALSSADTAGPGTTRAFDIVITLQTPFLYHPSMGHLLLDVRNFDGTETTFFDAHNQTGDSISRVFTEAAGVTGTTGNADTFGLVTQFTTTSAAPAAVPEPTSMLLLGTGLAGIAARRYRQRKARP